MQFDLPQDQDLSEFRNVPGKHNIFASRRGQVFDLRCGVNPQNRKEPMYRLNAVSGLTSREVAEMVLSTFDKPRPYLAELMFLDGDETNTRFPNLYWLIPGEQPRTIPEIRPVPYEDRLAASSDGKLYSFTGKLVEGKRKQLTKIIPLTGKSNRYTRCSLELHARHIANTFCCVYPFHHMPKRRLPHYEVGRVDGNPDNLHSDNLYWLNYEDQTPIV